MLGWTLCAGVVRPKSRGRIRLTGPDPTDPVQIEANMLSHPDDLKAARAGSRARELLVSGADFSAQTGIDDDTGIWLMRHLQYKIPMMWGFVGELLSGH